MWETRVWGVSAELKNATPLLADPLKKTITRGRSGAQQSKCQVNKGRTEFRIDFLTFLESKHQDSVKFSVSCMILSTVLKAEKRVKESFSSAFLISVQFPGARTREV